MKKRAVSLSLVESFPERSQKTQPALFLSPASLLGSASLANIRNTMAELQEQNATWKRKQQKERNERLRGVNETLHQ